ncbi:helix-turn-helix domain-containing protein [Corynebacterium wankanglinii]|uniref:Helix-turn-helix domain-containing protein n=1 Tax=Corynebacterium wankanglinii TaxID=2735136 RepID=A0A838CK47_9CORY|nr:helix-turn-helix domain-containing protein [Corynebacterium wankanglinii]MBA1835424.1 helix-turn-helix domain-containing protein [Corynebacterium wankanglinii]
MSISTAMGGASLQTMPPRNRRAPQKKKRAVDAATSTTHNPVKEIEMQPTKQEIKCRTYSAADTALILGIGKSTLLENVNRGDADHLRAIRVGTTIRFPIAVIDGLTAGAA